METALQELISKLTDIKNDLVSNYENAKKEQERTEISIEIVATLSAISEAKKLLPKEREQIEGSWEAGNYVAKYRLENETQYQSTAQEYYETNFNK
jgi:hypothetical protein